MKNVIFLQMFVHKNVKYIDISLIKMYYFLIKTVIKWNELHIKI